MGEAFNSFIGQFRATFGLWGPLVIAPIWQEIVFRYLPYKYISIPYDHFWLVGLITATLYGLIHWYFGLAFVVVAFVWGLILWYMVREYGLLAIIILHSVVNLIAIYLGILNVETR
jgi:membrane protease YdiL (CAAX protease family)